MVGTPFSAMRSRLACQSRPGLLRAIVRSMPTAARLQRLRGPLRIARFLRSRSVQRGGSSSGWSEPLFEALRSEARTSSSLSTLLRRSQSSDRPLGSTRPPQHSSARRLQARLSDAPRVADLGVQLDPQLAQPIDRAGAANNSLGQIPQEGDFAPSRLMSLVDIRRHAVPRAMQSSLREQLIGSASRSNLRSDSHLSRHLRRNLVDDGTGRPSRRNEQPRLLRDANGPIERRASSAMSPHLNRSSVGQIMRRPPAREFGLSGDSAKNVEGSGSDSQSSTMILSGEVIIDGRRLGEIVAAHQARALTSEPAGSRFLNLRASPLSVGSSVPPP